MSGDFSTQENISKKSFSCSGKPQLPILINSLQPFTLFVCLLYNCRVICIGIFQSSHFWSSKPNSPEKARSPGNVMPGISRMVNRKKFYQGGKPNDFEYAVRDLQQDRLEQLSNHGSKWGIEGNLVKRWIVDQHSQQIWHQHWLPALNIDPSITPETQMAAW